jgi:hypothetical protein
VADRVLEQDSDGRWCWAGGTLLVVPRQQGKSTLMRVLGAWMAEHLQFRVLSAAPVLKQLDAVLADALDWAEDDGLHVWRAMDRPAIRWPHGGHWQGQTAKKRLGVSATTDAALLDEVWDMEADAVTRGLLPSMSSRPNPFLLMASTADVEGSELMRRWRNAAQNDPNVAVMEWAAPAHWDWRDPKTWEAATPHWTPERQRFLAQQINLVPEVDFRTQYLNQEPRAIRSQRWVDLSELVDPHPVPTGPVVAAVDGTPTDDFAVAVGWHGPDMLIHVKVEPAESLKAALSMVSAVRPMVVLMHPSTRKRLAVETWPTHGMSTTDLAAATGAFRAAASERRLRYTGDLLADQLPAAGLSTHGLLSARHSHGDIYAVKAAAWVAWAVETRHAPAAGVF